ncbi:putative inner membrane protein [compost metagenome]
MHFWVVGVGNVIGGTLVAAFWDQLGSSLALPYPKLNLLQSFGPAGGLLLTFVGLGICMLLVQLNANRFTRPRNKAHDREENADAVA